MKKQSSDTKCDAMTKGPKSHRCKNTGIFLVGDGEHFLCYVHWQNWYEDRHGTPPKEPWSILAFPVEPDVEKLSQKAITEIRKHLREGPSASQPGHIYVFQAVHDDIKEMYKIGFTTQGSPEKRLEQWPGSILVDSWETPYANYTETLIHLFLQFWRVYRFVLYAAKQKPGQHKRYISVWYEEPETLICKALPKDSTWIPDNLCGTTTTTREINVKTKKEHRYDYEKEWFLCEYKYITHIINGILKGIHNNANLKHWKDPFVK